MKFVKFTNDHSQAWNDFIMQSKTASPYHLTHWLDAVAQAYGHKNTSLLAIDEHQEIQAVMPICEFKTLKQKKMLCSLPFCDVGGAIGREDEFSRELNQQFINQFDRTTYEVRQRGLALSDEEVETKTGTNVKVSMIMPLAQSAEELLASFKPKLRSQIKKAGKNGLTTQLVQDDSLIDDFYHVIARNMRDLGSPVHSKLFYQQIMKNYDKKAATAVVYQNGQPCAAGLVLQTQVNGCIPWASSLREFNKLAPNMLLYWTLLAHMADAGIQSFDFGRSTINEGTYRFKKQWGAQPVALHWVGSQEHENKADKQPVTTSRARSLVESIWRRLPVNTTTIIGPRVRKFISL